MMKQTKLIRDIVWRIRQQISELNIPQTAEAIGVEPKMLYRIRDGEGISIDKILEIADLISEKKLKKTAKK